MRAEAAAAEPKTGLDSGNARAQGPRMNTALDRVSQTLPGRIRALAERYATPLSQLTGEVATRAARVEEHLNNMGF